MTPKFTRTQLLAQCVNANVVFFSFGDDSYGADPIVAVFRDEASIESFAFAHGRSIEYPSVYWQEVPLQGPDLPYTTWPEISELFLVTEGGIGDTEGDTEIDPVALGAFVDPESAAKFAQSEHNPNVVVRHVPLDVALAIPSRITGDPFRY